MKQRLISTLMIVAFIMSMMPMIITPAKATIHDYEPMRIGPKFREENLLIEGFPSYLGTGNPTKVWLVLDDYNGYYFFDLFELRAEGDICEIWVQEDLSYPPGDPRDYPVVTDEQVEYMLYEFENTVYPIDTDYFGDPDFHDGTYSLLVDWGYFPEGYYYSEEGKNVILVSNVRDTNYYDPDYRLYIAGFYSPSLEAYHDRNIISIDSHDWENRLGPDVARPYLYESVVAHEYQHLIHDDYNPDDPSFMNEACSMFAEILTYNLIDWSAINDFLYTPDNSLTEWEDQGNINVLADYGQVQLWGAYLNDHYGEEFLGYFVQSGIPGVEGINNALENFGYRDRFDDVFHNWRIANLIHTDFPGCGKYNYETIDLGSEDAIPATMHEVEGFFDWKHGTDFGTTWVRPGDEYDTGIATIGPYGTDYIKLYNWKNTGTIYFNGDDVALYGWRMIDGEWWSGEGNMADFKLVSQEVTVDGDDPFLTLVTAYAIEYDTSYGEGWDFGFVQVSTDEGETWDSLENEYTTYDYATNVQEIIDNLPGLSYVNPDWPDWTTMTFNLSDYAGETVMICFRYMTDQYVNWPGWYIESASVSGIPLELSTTYPEADFMVTAIYAFVIGKCTIYLPVDMWLCDKTEWGVTLGAKKPSYTILIVSSTSEHGWVDYTFSAKRFRWRMCRIRELDAFN